MSELNNKFDIFISYQWDIKELVLQLYNFIHKKVTKKIWLDKFQIKSGTVLFEELKQGIDNSSTIICCITKAYARSQNCQDEFGYSLFTKKPMLVLVFEKLDLANDIGWIGFKIVNTTRCNIYKDLELFKNETGPVYDEMMTAIYALVGSNNIIVKTKDTNPKNKKVDQTAKNEQVILNEENNKIANECLTIDQLYDQIEIFETNKDYDNRCSVCYGSVYYNSGKIWKYIYCESCLKNLKCYFCEYVFEGTDNVYKGKNRHLYCIKCVLNEDSIFNARYLIHDKDHYNIHEFYVNKCYSCQKTRYELDSEITVFLWGHYYCSNCFENCKKCKNSIGHMKYKNDHGYIYCSKECAAKSSGACNII
jgi:hypothetical protein